MTVSVYTKNCLSCNGKNLEYFGNFYMKCYQKDMGEPMVNLIHCRDCHFASIVMLTKEEVDNHKKTGKNPHNEIIQSVSNNKPISSYSCYC